MDIELSTIGTAGTQTAPSASVSQRHLDAGTRSPALFLARIPGVNRIIRWLAAIALILLAASNASAAATTAVTIGPEASVPLPSSAKFSLWIGNAPDDNSVQTLNPPVFKWIYYNDPWHMGDPNQSVQSFRFQLSTNGNFTNPYWDIITSNNFYNCLAPITNADGSAFLGTNFWRIIYMNSTATINVATGAVHTFTLAANATEWNRSMFANTSFLLSVGTNHPHLFFSATNRVAMAAFLHTNHVMGFSWLQLTQQVYQTITNSWWNNDSVTNQNPQVIVGLVAPVCLAYQIDSNATLKAANPGQMASRVASLFIAKNEDQVDAYTLSENGKSIPLCYDWAYDDMTVNQRSNVLWTMEKFSQFIIYNDWWYAGTAASPDRSYTNPNVVGYWSHAKTGSSHPRHDCSEGLFMSWAGMGESALLRDHLSYYLNYSIAQVDPFAGDEGRFYAEQSFRDLHGFSSQLLLACVDPRMTNNPWYSKYPKMFAYQEPLNYSEAEDQYGDFGVNWQFGQPGTALFNYKYFDLALMNQNGSLLRQQVRNYTIRCGSADFYPLLGEAFLPYYFPRVPTETDWPDSYYFDENDGWCMSYSYPPNNWNCFTNGVGFVLTARPAGQRRDHSSWHDGSIQVWAYGAQVTAGGIGQYWKHPLLNTGLFVDGIGDCTPDGDNPTAEWYSRLTAFTNTSDFTFVSADLSQSFNNWNTNRFAGNGLENLEQAYNYPSNSRPYVVSVQRSVVFPHKKYVVLYDSFQTTTNATFQWKWNILEPTAVVNTNAFRFTYTSTNFFNRSNVTTYVQHIVDPAKMTMFYGVGTNYAVSNIFTKEDFTTSAVTLPGEAKWNSTIWVYNTTKTTNWHFMSVIYPVKWGQAAPTITRIDDNSVRVQQGTDDDTITVDPSTPTPTFTLNLSGPSLGPTHLAPPSDLRVAP
jgi:hypothetical protein